MEIKNVKQNNRSESIEVSVIVPCFNEENTITLLLEAIKTQTYPINNLEVIIADALSTDQTRKKIRQYLQKNQDLSIQVIDNPKQTIPAAINLAANAAKGVFIVRLDAHSIPNPKYIELCIRVLKKGIASCVGGVWDIVPGDKSWIARSIAAAASHPLGVGDAQYRFTKNSGYVDTVPFGSFSKELFIKIGGFNESLLTNEDYEFFTRIRKNHGKIWIDPEIRCTYFARKDLKALAQQYWRYGFWKYRMLVNFPDTLRWRQGLPPLFVFSVIVLGLLSVIFRYALIALLSLLGFYAIALLGTSIQTGVKKSDPGLIIGMPISIACMHFSWGTGFLYSIIKGWFK
jgi:succinoglycan biosynthesis protein ExoA